MLPFTPKECIETVEMHTGGEPLRIVISGFPQPEGETILDKRKYCEEKLDKYRKRIINEPRGHFDMYAVLMVPPNLPEADFAVLFMHNAGYSVMCGHATIAVSRYAIESGKVKAVEPETDLAIQCPCGLVQVKASVKDGKVGQVRFVSVPAFAAMLNVKVTTKEFGELTVDVSFGGTFYVLMPAKDLGLDLRSSKVSELKRAAAIVTDAAREQLHPKHPEFDDLNFIYGTILTDGNDTSSGSQNCCVFADAEVDRSPTGSGVTARIALQFAKGQVKMNEKREFESVVHSKFTGMAVETMKHGPFDAVRVEVSGSAHYWGTCRLIVEDGDPLGDGFLLA
eukprot:TRINITY_DN67821_c5_g6_i1.p1 TRINITY_DN67821_c5_g6~~TRINITY_DN67821_c5_g6_i1.p1  ORF type:complete len:338 (-),score=34.66 TRINITY_DN67821_c5_g6_i1:39-1052(-)